MTTRHGRGNTTSGSLSPSTAVSPLTLSPSSSMALSAELTEGEVLGGNNEPGSRRSSFYNNGNTQSKEEQEDNVFKMLQRQTASALRGEKLPPAIKQDDNTTPKGKHAENNNLPTSYDVATLQFG